MPVELLEIPHLPISLAQHYYFLLFLADPQHHLIVLADLDCLGALGGGMHHIDSVSVVIEQEDGLVVEGLGFLDPGYDYNAGEVDAVNLPAPGLYASAQHQDSEGNQPLVTDYFVGVGVGLAGFVVQGRFAAHWVEVHSVLARQYIISVF